MNFEWEVPPPPKKVEFPATGEGLFRRAIFFLGAAVAVLCGLVVVGSVAVALVYGALALIKR